MRAILVQPALAPGALEELKNWLAISGPREDASLSALLAASVEICEAFTRQMPLECQCEELLPALHDWQMLRTMPVQAITGIYGVGPAGDRQELAAGSYAIDLIVDGSAKVRLLSPAVAGTIAVRFTAGIAVDWASLPAGLRHGIVRLAAHNFRQREADGGKPVPPASVAALWNPWRRLRLL